MRRVCQVLVVAMLAAGLAACASGPGAYSLGKTKKCLAKEGVRFRKLTPKSDYIASIASGGAVALVLPQNRVTLTFGEDDKEAASDAAGYRRLGSFATVQTQRNVVLVWTQPPSDQEAKHVGGCLK